MKNAQKPGHISLNVLINWIRAGRFVVPDFQREFEWDTSDIKELMRSIFLDYYIGSLLLWKGKAPATIKSPDAQPDWGWGRSVHRASLTPGNGSWIVLGRS